jgi:hypothetical protein
MAKPKTYTTIGRYLFSQEQALLQQQAIAELNGRTVTLMTDGHRQIINHLLPQIGVVGLIGQTENALDGVKRLRAAATDDKQIKDLDVVARWLAEANVKVAV